MKFTSTIVVRGGLTLLLTLLLLNHWAVPGMAQDARITALEAEVKVLKEQVAQLRALMPTFTGFMPDFSERFHVMHRAGEAEDWALASHEMLEMKRLVGVAKAVDAEKGALFATFMNPALDKINATIEHGNVKVFLGAMEETVVSCNACHKAAGSPFIQVSLDADRIMSMRHAHVLQKSMMMRDHTHKH